MMDYTLIKDVYKDAAAYGEKAIQVGGWCRTNRVSKAFGFLELNDGTFFKNIQVVYEEGLANFQEAERISVGSSVTVTGKLVLTPEAKQPFEIKAEQVCIDGMSAPDYPLQKKRHTFEYLRTQAHLRPRTNAFSAVFRVRSIAAFAIHQFFNEKGFVYVNTPIITGSDCEGAGEMFRVTTMDLNDIPRNTDGTVDNSQDFFGMETNLGVSGQLYGECYAMAFRNIYTFGPTFRAENSNTARHAAEFWMMEPEMAFADLADNMEIAEEMLRYVISYILENAKEEIEFFNAFVETGLIEKLTKLVDSDFGRVTYTEAIELLLKSGQDFQYPVKWGVDLQTEHERYLAETVFNKPVFVTDYPKDIKAFYMRMNEDEKTVAAMDLLVPSVGELIGGSQREERHDVLLERIREMGLNEADYSWYLELRRFGTVKHSGFGLGFERLIMYATGMSNIRDVCAFPRTVNSLEF